MVETSLKYVDFNAITVNLRAMPSGFFCCSSFVVFEFYVFSILGDFLFAIFFFVPIMCALLSLLGIVRDLRAIGIEIISVRPSNNKTLKYS